MPPDELPDAETWLDEAPCGMLLTTSNGRIERVNQTFCNWLGRERETLLGQRFQNLLSMGGKIFCQTHWYPLLQMRGSVSEIKLELIHADGRHLPMMLNALRREGAACSYHQLALFMAEERNLYERELLAARKLAEELLQQQLAAQKELNSAQNRLRLAHAESQIRATFAEQMIGIVSHDLRNPLTAIKMASGLLDRLVEDERHKRVAGHITHAVDRASRLIADLLDFTQARVGQGLSVNQQAIDLHAVIGRCVEELRLAFPERRLVHLREGEGRCNADADRLFQVVSNLVGNAISYGNPDSDVTVTSGFGSKGSRVSVHNHGEPIPVERQDELFEPLVRGTANEHSRSVGLGLFIVREIARAHFGEISVQSNAEQGTTFTVRLPKVF
ncbi:PAS domain-containing sensor histidine kinase [Pseudomonas sp. DTU_2021_1001937_2_SI_NGA_ILE_001]|uniref:PAS domain-containing sensor histidine kinase n=1 Tax=Pseudomonas sp. DTU_2021_1001937_2_SI_NGA_ILE_001 TaxID=3077589 RepID=UPI0028FC12E1|nr:PAS domain-containing sensor histidine kinase [Pseudomonas sp. DTU_2021_1001937_2_SI_NGA_ILE_001]WNW13766.1 PAS domain-containing sensor histidine kinase [Pseudomonas sp. DTU_2021_1001937_2_SI_NGA_ILE_001]